MEKGKSFVFYNPTVLTYKGFDKSVKVDVHRRDANKCQLCFKKKLLVTHHINYNKQDSHPFNLITLCWDCHTKTYHHKNDWLRLFTERMTERFGDDYKGYLISIDRRNIRNR